jgi:predicted amidohydrolase
MHLQLLLVLALAHSLRMKTGHASNQQLVQQPVGMSHHLPPRLKKLSRVDSEEELLHIRVAGAQTFVSPNVSNNTLQLLRAIDVAGVAGADYLLTAEGAVSGYIKDSDQVNMLEVKTSIKTLVNAAQAVGVGLILGTMYQEGPDAAGKTQQRWYNQQRVYSKSGAFVGWNAKQLLTPGEASSYTPGTGSNR